MKRDTCVKIFITAIAVNLVLVTLSLAAVPRVEAASPEYIQITGRGDSMYPAIADGDTVTVEMFTDVNAIKVGEIIVYGSIAALAWNPNPTSIWIAHRVTEKYVKDGELCFRTKGDNNPKEDPWKVPAYWVTGKVIDVSHTGHPPQTVPEDRPLSTQYTPAYNLEDVETLFAAAGCIGLVAIVGHRILSSRKKQYSPSQNSFETCVGCRHYEPEFAYSLVQVGGRWEMRKTTTLSRGHCRKLGIAVFDGVLQRKCNKYELRQTDISQETV